VLRVKLLSRFEEIYSLVAAPSTARLEPTLGPLVRQLFLCLGGIHSLTRNVNTPGQVQQALVDLMKFLLSASGRTSAHWRVARDCILSENEWEMDWSYLPEPLEDVLFELTLCLSDGEADPTLPQFAESMRALQSTAEGLPLAY
jgi:hypothetical protein